MGKWCFQGREHFPSFYKPFQPCYHPRQGGCRRRVLGSRVLGHWPHSLCASCWSQAPAGLSVRTGLLAAAPKYNLNDRKFQEMSQDKMPGGGSRPSTWAGGASEKPWALSSISLLPNLPCANSIGAAETHESIHEHKSLEQSRTQAPHSSWGQLPAGSCAGASPNSHGAWKSPAREKRTWMVSGNGAAYTRPTDVPCCPPALSCSLPCLPATPPTEQQLSGIKAPKKVFPRSHKTPPSRKAKQHLSRLEAACPVHFRCDRYPVGLGAFGGTSFLRAEISLLLAVTCCEP